MRKQVGLKFEEELVDRADAKAEQLGISRTQLFELALEAFMDPASEPVVEAHSERVQVGRKLDTYPSAPSDPAARRDWTGRRAAGWSAFGVPNHVQNAELIEAQRKAQSRG